MNTISKINLPIIRDRLLSQVVWLYYVPVSSSDGHWWVNLVVKKSVTNITRISVVNIKMRRMFWLFVRNRFHSAKKPRQFCWPSAHDLDSNDLKTRSTDRSFRITAKPNKWGQTKNKQLNKFQRIANQKSNLF